MQGVGNVGFGLAEHLKKAGAANNQLAEPGVGDLLARGILDAPDYVINAGGIIDVYRQRIGFDAA